FLVVFGSVVLYTFTVTPAYEARTQLLIENLNPNVVKFEEVYDQNKSTNDYYQTQYRILQSRLIARRVLDTEKLWRDPIFAGTNSRFPTNPLLWGAAITRLFKDPASTPEKTETAEQSRAIDAFLELVTVTPLRNSRLVDVKFESPDPALSAR